MHEAGHYVALKTLGYDVCMDDIIIDKINLKGYIKHEVDVRLDDEPDALFHEMIITYAGIIAEMQILGYPSGIYISYHSQDLDSNLLIRFCDRYLQINHFSPDDKNKILWQAKMQTEELLKKENALLHQTITELEERYLI